MSILIAALIICIIVLLISRIAVNTKKHSKENYKDANKVSEFDSEIEIEIEGIGDILETSKPALNLRGNIDIKLEYDELENTGRGVNSMVNMYIFEGEREYNENGIIKNHNLIDSSKSNIQPHYKGLDENNGNETNYFGVDGSFVKIREGEKVILGYLENFKTQNLIPFYQTKSGKRDNLWKYEVDGLEISSKTEYHSNDEIKINGEIHFVRRGIIADA